MSKDYFYLTTTLPYVNSDPHIGFALELVQADAIVRYHKDVLGEEVFFNTGTDEHGAKIQRKAESLGIDTQKYVNEFAEKFKQLLPVLGISSDIHFIRTTDEHHKKACQEFWKLCEKNGDIYKKVYKIKYCVGCELEKTESDLDENGKCLIHPHLEIELIDEENYFFRFSKYQQPLLDLYKKYPDFVVPSHRLNEIQKFVEGGLQDFSISRLKSKMSWGVPVPGDDTQVMYVWFDALINYISTLGWGDNNPSQPPLMQRGGEMDTPSLHKRGQGEFFQDFWGTQENPNALQIAGKDNLRQQASMWQAMLLSAGLPTSRQIIIHGFINSGGQKMSKSLGNVANPFEIIEKLKTLGLTDEQAGEALRYYLLREISTFEDGDYTWEKFVESYNAGLANGIGNLTSRILKMAVNSGIKSPESRIMSQDNISMEKYELQKVVDAIWKKIQDCDVFIQKNEPFKKIKVDADAGKKDIEFLLSELSQIAFSLKPFLPLTSEKILQSLKEISSENIPRLFPRI
jgi:methionyl-tRNA synthetase